MEIVILSIWGVQGFLTFFDEFIFHKRRGLGKWERVGHPMDSFFFLIPFIYTQFFSSSYVFLGLCLFSCLIITKDEFVHSKECEGSEQLLHALLFVIHPIALMGLALAWEHKYNTIIQIQASIIFLFMIYQIVYWNFIAGKQNEA